MKIRHWLLWGLTLAAGLAPLSAQPSSGLKPDVDHLSFEESVDRAFQSNTHLLSAQQDMAIAKSHLKQAKSLYYPTVALNLNYIRYRNETDGITPPDLGYAVLKSPAAGALSDPPTENLYLGRVGFRQTLYAGGRLQSTYKLSKANLERAKTNYESLKQDLRLDTARSFYALVAAQEKREFLVNARVQLDALSKRDSGAHARLGMALFRSELRQQLSNLEKQTQDSRFDYLQTMGMELFSTVEPRGDLGIPARSLNAAQLVAWAKENRNELRETLLQEEVDRLSVNLSLADRYPTFLLGGGYEMRDSDLPIEDNNWNAGLTMNIPIFDGFASIARIRESRSRAQQGRFRRVELEDSIEREVRSAYGDYVHWSEELSNLRKEQETLARSSARSGAASERMDWIRWNLMTNLNMTQARYELCLANARLERAVGRSLTTERLP